MPQTPIVIYGQVYTSRGTVPNSIVRINSSIQTTTDSEGKYILDLANLKQRIKKAEDKKEDLAYSVQETIFAMLLEVSERAMAHCGKKELLLGGGVACNLRLQEMAKKMCKDRDAKCFIPENQFLVDNGAMMAWQGILEYNAGKRCTEGWQEIELTNFEEIKAKQYLCNQKECVPI